MSSDSHPYEPATPESADGISDSEAQMLARRLAEKKDQVDYLKGLLHRFLKLQMKVRTADDDGEWVRALSQMTRLRDEASDVLKGDPEYDARASAEGSSS
jgi:hypothetical protein